MSENQNNVIHVWRFEDAPARYRELSTNGGDEDWVALVPKEIADEDYIGWLEPGSAFGVFTIDRYLLPEGYVYIGAHS